MTKPAAIFLQIIGAFTAFAAFGMMGPDGSFGVGFWLLLLGGIGLIVWAGRATRKRIKQ